MRQEIVLIGPAAVGKSMVGALLSDCLHVPHVDLDKVGDSYYEAAGFPLEELDRRMFANYLDAYRWAVAALPYALEHVLTDHHDCVFSVAAIHTHYDEPAYFQRARQALEPFNNVVLLLPCDDPDRSIEILRARSIAERRMDWIFDATTSTSTGSRTTATPNWRHTSSTPMGKRRWRHATQCWP